MLHLLAAAQEGEIDFNISDIDRLSRKVPQLCKVAPSTPKYHMEDVHRAGGVIGILGELDRAGLIDTSARNILQQTMRETLDQYDIMLTKDQAVKDMFRAGPAGIRTTQAFHRIAAGTRWTTTAPRDVFAPVSTPIRRMAVWRCSTATSPKMAVSSKRPA